MRTWRLRQRHGGWPRRGGHWSYAINHRAGPITRAVSGVCIWEPSAVRPWGFVLRWIPSISAAICRCWRRSPTAPMSAPTASYRTISTMAPSVPWPMCRPCWQRCAKRRSARRGVCYASAPGSWAIVWRWSPGSAPTRSWWRAWRNCPTYCWSCAPSPIRLRACWGWITGAVPWSPGPSTRRR